jgi:hypothetical protein
MSSKDSPTLREEERRASESLARARGMIDSSILKDKSNDQDKPLNPNEVRERYLKRLRC